MFATILTVGMLSVPGVLGMKQFPKRRFVIKHHRDAKDQFRIMMFLDGMEHQKCVPVGEIGLSWSEGVLNMSFTHRIAGDEFVNGDGTRVKHVGTHLVCLAILEARRRYGYVTRVTVFSMAYKNNKQGVTLAQRQHSLLFYLMLGFWIEDEECKMCFETRDPDHTYFLHMEPVFLDQVFKNYSNTSGKFLGIHGSTTPSFAPQYLACGSCSMSRPDPKCSKCYPTIERGSLWQKERSQEFLGRVEYAEEVWIKIREEENPGFSKRSLSASMRAQRKAMDNGDAIPEMPDDAQWLLVTVKNIQTGEEKLEHHLTESEKSAIVPVAPPKYYAHGAAAR